MCGDFPKPSQPDGSIAPSDSVGGSHKTRRWREMDSNHRYPAKETALVGCPRSIPGNSPSATEPASFATGTDGSNPPPSSGESAANLSSAPQPPGADPPEDHRASQTARLDQVAVFVAVQFPFPSETRRNDFAHINTRKFPIDPPATLNLEAPKSSGLRSDAREWSHPGRNGDACGPGHVA